MKANKLLILLTGGIVALSFSACGAGGNYIPADYLAKAIESFKLVPPSQSFAVGDKFKLIPVIVQADGQSPLNPPIEWKISDEKIAKIDKDGTITAISDGSVIVTAKLNGQETTTVINISKTPVVPSPSGSLTPGAASPSVSPGAPGTEVKNNPTTLSKIKSIIVKLPTETVPVVDYNIDRIDGTLTFAAQAIDADNKPLSDVTFTWSSSDTTIALVNSTGVVTALASGSSNIIVTAGDKTSNIVRVIVPQGKINVNVNFQGD